jgi:hypothetical protein
VNRRTGPAGKVPVELLFADSGEAKDGAVLRDVDPRAVQDFLKLLPKERIDPSLFVETGT